MRARGYILLLVLVAVLLLALIAVASLSLSQAERQSGTVERDQVMAQAQAEEGVQRAHAYLSAMLDTDADLDRALDPHLDTTCTVSAPGLVLGGARSDDHLPLFGNGASVTAGPAGLTWTQVQHLTDAGAAGGYLVRIDDNADDFDPSLPAAATGNSGCPELTVALDGGQNPVRDRDRTVEVTVVGYSPGASASQARALKTLRATFGPSANPGIATNGTVDMQGSSHVCEKYAGVVARGDILGACLCGTACPGGTACPQDDLCDARAGGTCTASGLGGGGICQAAQTIDPTPRVNPWDRLNAPVSCPGASCEPFWYLREAGAVELWQWNYAGAALDGVVGGCRDPRRFSRICHPLDTAATCAGASCWRLQQVGGTDGGSIDDLRLRDSAGYAAAPPPVIPYDGAAPVVWHRSASGSTSGGGCGGAATPPYPYPAGGAGLGWDDDIDTEFDMRANGAATPVEHLPRGTWFVEGNVKWDRDSPGCGALPAGWRLTIVAVGDLHFHKDASFRPSNPRGVAAVAGRDLKLCTGNTDVRTCGESAAFLAHEQFNIGGNMTLEGQLVVDNRGTCSSEVTGTAVQLTGGGVVRVPQYPPIAMSRSLAALWASPSAF